jgi:hypothetical protein
VSFPTIRASSVILDMPKTERDLEHCPHCEHRLRPDFLIAAGGAARQAMRSTFKGREKILTPCPKCGDPYGVAEMRAHKPHCNGVSRLAPVRPSRSRVSVKPVKRVARTA